MPRSESIGRGSAPTTAAGWTKDGALCGGPNQSRRGHSRGWHHPGKLSADVHRAEGPGSGPAPLHPTDMHGGSSRDAIAAFKQVLDRARIPATVRLTRGRDIAAACGQLAVTR